MLWPTPKTSGGIFWTACILVFAVSMVYQPQIVFQGAVNGLKAWWNIVFPSLLPFFIASELLMSFGLVEFMGVLMEPLMRPLFNVPGCGGFVLCIGYTSGYPIGSMVTARLRSQRKCTRIEAERLISFTNNSSPLFMIVAVSVGMFGRPELGFVIAGAHYLANLTLGLCLRFYGRNDPERLPPASRENPGRSLMFRAFSKLVLAWENEKRPPGKIMGDAVSNAVTSLTSIGGFIILFAVVIKLLSNAGIIGHMAGLMGVMLQPLGFCPEIMTSLASGFFEMTIGCKTASESSAPLMQQVAAVEIILAWSGLSVLAQVASMISQTDIRMLPFVCSRLAHAALATLYTFIFFGPTIQMAAGMFVPAAAILEKMEKSPPLLLNFKLTGILLLAAVVLLLILSLTYVFTRKITFHYIKR